MYKVRTNYGEMRGLTIPVAIDRAHHVRSTLLMKQDNTEEYLMGFVAVFREEGGAVAYGWATSCGFQAPASEIHSLPRDTSVILGPEYAKPANNHLVVIDKRAHIVSSDDFYELRVKAHKTLIWCPEVRYVAIYHKEDTTTWKRLLFYGECVAHSNGGNIVWGQERCYYIEIYKDEVLITNNTDDVEVS